MAANIEIESSEANFNLSATSGFARTTVCQGYGLFAPAAPTFKEAIQRADTGWGAALARVRHGYACSMLALFFVAAGPPIFFGDFASYNRR
jgi:hypothetical protein